MKAVEIIYRYETRDVPARPRPLDGDAALVRLGDGNRDFASLLDTLKDENSLAQRVVRVDPRDLGLLPRDTGVPRQRPFAAILGCSDARVPIELIFNEGPNDLFVIRVAGNGLGTEVLGSLKYAVEHLRASLKLIVVLGHSGCGALATAVDVFLNPSEYLPLVAEHSLRNILDRLLVVVHASARALLGFFGPDIALRPGYRQALIEASIVTNAALAAYSIQQQIGTSDPAELRVAYGVYLLENREVWTPFLGKTKGVGLAAPPKNPAGFSELRNAIVQSERIASLVNAEPTSQR
jgi:carbonic anhydrase